MWGIITNDKRVQLGCFRLTFKGIYNLFLIVDTVVSVMFDHHSLQSLFFNDGANCSFSSLYKSACKSSFPRWKVASAKTSRQEAKGQTGKDDWCYSKTEGYALLPDLLYLAFSLHPLCFDNITDQLSSCVQARSLRQSKWSQHAICLHNTSTPHPAFSSSHLDNSLAVAGQLSSGHFLSWQCGIYYSSAGLALFHCPVILRGRATGPVESLSYCPSMYCLISQKKKKKPSWMNNWFQLPLMRIIKCYLPSH